MGTAIRLAGIALGTLLLGEIAIALSIPPGLFVPVWPVAGLALAAAVLRGRITLLPAALGTLVVGFDLATRSFGAAPQAAVIFALGAAAGTVAQAELGLRLMTWRRDGRDWLLENPGEILRIVALAAPAGAVAMAFALALGTALAGLNPPAGYLTIALKAWLSTAVGIAAFTPILLLLAAPAPVSLRRKIAVVLPMSLLLGVALAAFVLIRNDALDRRQAAFAEITSDDHESVVAVLGSVERRLQELGGLFAASETVTPEEFDTFVAIAFGRFLPVAEIRWAPRTEGPGNAAADERIAPQRSPNAPPVFYGLDPADPDGGIGIVSSVRGIDIAGFLDSTLARGGVVTAMLWLNDPDSGPAPYLVLTAPSYAGPPIPDTLQARRDRLSGLAIGIFAVPGVFDLASTHHQTFYRLHINEIADATQPPQIEGKLVADYDLQFDNDASWRFSYVARPAFLMTHQDRISWAVLVVSLAFITLLNALALLSTARTDLVQRLVEAKTAEAAALSRNLALVLEHAADGIVSTDETGQTVLVNTAAADLLGYEPEELTGRRLRETAHSQDEVGGLFSASSREPVRNGVERFRRKDGSSVTAEFSSAPILDEEGRAQGAVIVFRDIAQRLEDQAERERFIEELSRANEELERFAFAASHDLQEPLRLIANFNALLARRCGDRLGEAGLSYVEHSIRAAERMQALITDLLAYGRLHHDPEPRRQAVQMSAAAEEALRNLAPAIEASGAVVMSGRLPEVRGNPAQLAQLMQNLIGNAIKYQAPDAHPQVTVEATGAGAQWRVSVSDNGIGIAADYRESIFQPFKRLHAKDEYSGTGMGLAICRKIVESHGGVIWVEDNPAGGSRFVFTLPRDDTAAHDSSHASS